MSGDPKQKGKLPDHVVAPEGTSLFKTVNFERYAVLPPNMNAPASTVALMS